MEVALIYAKVQEGPLAVNTIRVIQFSEMGLHKPTVSPLLLPVASRNALLLKSLPTNIPY
jgi:hypothetical protein